MWKKCEKDTGVKLELPWGQNQTLFFLDWLLTDRGLSSATASSYLAGIRKIHELRGVEEPKIRKGLVNQIIKGKQNMEALKKRTSDDKGRLPITLTLMKLIKEELRISGFVDKEKLLIWTVATVAFHGSLRIHEILCRNETFFDPDFCMLGKDFALGSHAWEDGQVVQRLSLTIKCPKESKKGGTVIVDIYETGGPTCPIRAFQRWMKLVKIDGGSILFRNDIGVPLTGRRFNEVIRSLLSRHVDYSKGSITSHSFRSGIPSLLGSLGHSNEEIKKVGRWSSRAFECYTKLPRTSRAAISRKLGKI